MAPTNKSRGISPNTIYSEKHENVFARRAEPAVGEFDKIGELTEIVQNLMEQEANYAQTGDPDIARQISKLEKMYDQAQTRLGRLRQGRGIVAHRAIESIAREMRSSQGIQREVSYALDQEPNVIGAAGLAMTTPSLPGESMVDVKSRLIEQRKSLHSQMQQNAAAYSLAAKSALEEKDPEKVRAAQNTVAQKMSEREKLAHKLAITESGLSYIGADEKTLTDVQVSAAQNVAKRQRIEDARSYVLKGQQRTLGELAPIELKRKERDLQETVAKQYKEFGALTTQYGTLKEKSEKSGDKKEIQETKEAYDKLQEAIKKLTTSTEELQKVQTVAAAGGRGGAKGILSGIIKGDPGALHAAGQALKTVGQLGLIGAEVYQTLSVTRPNMIVDNQTRAAGISNQLFDMRKAALSGDMTALTLLSSGSIERASKSAEDRRSTMKNIAYTRAASKGGMAAGEGLQLVGGTIDAMEDAAISGIPKAAGALIKGGPGGAVKSLAGSATKGLTYGLTDPTGSAQLVNTAGYAADAVQEVALAAPAAEQEALSEFQRQLELDKQLSYVTGQQRQVAYDYFKGNINASRSLGVSGSDRFLSQMSEERFDRSTGKSVNTNLEKLGKFGISTEDFNKLSEFGAAEMGGMFDTKQILGAANLQHLGLGSMPQHMQRMATLSQAGANNPQASYASILEAAVTKGLDNSKNLDIIAQATSQSAQNSSAYRVSGLDITGVAGKELMSRVDANSVNKDADLMRTASNKERLDAAMGDVSASLASSILIGGMGKATGVKDLGTQTALTKLTTTDIEGVKKMAEEAGNDPNKKKMAAVRALDLGLGKLIKEDGTVDTAILEKAKKHKLEYGAGGGKYGIALGVQSDPRFQEFLEYGKKYGEVEAKLKYKDIANKIGQAQVFSDTEYSAAQRQLFNEDKQPNEQGRKISEAAKGEKAVDTSTMQGDKKRAAELEKAQAQLSTQMAQEASKAMGGFNSLIDGISASTQEWVKKGGQDFAKAAGQAATDFTKGTTVFTTGLNDLGKAMSDAAENVRKGKWPPPDDKNKKQ